MIRLIVSAVDDETELYGLTASDLQSDLQIGDTSISGILSYIPSYPNYSSVLEEQSGYYLALSFSANPGATITTELVPGAGKSKPVTDGFCVYRIMDKDNQAIRVSVTKKGCSSVTKDYSLNQLILGDWLRDSEKEKILDSESERIQADGLGRTD